MKRCKDLLHQAIENNKANPVNLAYLMDRISVLEGEPQLYGTQFDWGENGELSPNNYDDLILVNERRKTIGFPSLEQQTALIRKRAENEKQSPPTDPEMRKRDMEEWKKKVGWIK